ncbi:toprim domain-containing protein [Heyndrickxia ginsengihumi]|uniref:toprim domain-containing protein n=1 Tax=Heyndrickxia ginsengihumi TaxID=363870 RepID=UPI00047061B8|nr:toprim domain-containing protein [Heyndrickxia ginsengihumi]
MSEYNKLTYTTLNHALEDLNAQDMGRYFLCNCPSCKHHEAFMYKGTNFLNCNRENACGEKFILNFKEKDQNKEEIYSKKYSNEKKDSVHLTSEQRKAREWATKFINYVKNKTKNELDGFRGLSEDNCSNFIANLHNEKMVKHFFEQTKCLFKKDYTKLSFITKRNIIMPIYGEDEQIDRILMRSTIEENLGQKEVQLVLNPNAVNDYFFNVKPENEYVVVTEGPIDGYSYKEVVPNIGVISQSGSRKINSIQNFIRNHKDQFVDKTFILSFDQDRAGKIARFKWIEFLKEENLSFTEMTGFPENIKDANEWLQKDREGFRKSIENVIELNESLMILDKEKLALERIHAQDNDYKNDWFRIYTKDLVIGNIKVDKQTKEVIPPYGTDSQERIHFSPNLREAIKKRVSESLPYYQKCVLFIQNVDTDKIKDNKIYSLGKLDNKERLITFQKDHFIFENVPFVETSKGENMMFIQNVWIAPEAEKKIFNNLKDYQKNKAAPVTVRKSAYTKTIEYERV